MSQIGAFFQLIGFFWGHAGEFLKLLQLVWERLPNMAAILQAASQTLNTSAGLIGQAQLNAGGAFEALTDPLETVTVPSLSIGTNGFYNTLEDALQAMGIPIPIQPPANVRTTLNGFRVVTSTQLSTQTNPFGTVIAELEAQKQVIDAAAGNARNELEKTAAELAKLAAILNELAPEG